MITIDSTFMTSIGVTSVNNCSTDSVNNQYDFYNGIEMSGGTIVYNQYEFFKLASVNGVNHDDQYGFYKAIGEFYGEPIYDQYSFYQNATFDGVNPIVNQYNFFKDVCTYISGPPSQAPTANFSADVTTTYTLDTVTFTDTSTTPGPTITGWTWDFGDATTSTAQNPTHIYSAVTSETVELMVSSTGGTDTKTRTNYINVINAVPTADFTYDPTTGDTSTVFSFTADTTTPSANHPVISWAWDFGDGGTSTAETPTHTYSAITSGGTYSVSLTASTDQGSAVETKTDIITVSSAATDPNLIIHIDAWSGETSAVSGDTTWYDLSSYGHDFILNDGWPTPSEGIGPLWNENNAMEFEWSPNFDSVISSYTGTPTNWTYHIMVSTTYGGEQAPHLKPKYTVVNGDNSKYIYPFVNGFGFGSMYWSNKMYNGTTTINVASTTKFASGQYYLVTCTNDSTNGSKIYINGTLEGSGSYLDTTSINSYWSILGFKGNIGYLKVYDKELSSTEISDEWDAVKGRYGY